MGYLNQLRNAASRWVSGFVPIRGIKASADGLSVTMDPLDASVNNALRSAAYWACTRLISCSVGSLPCHVFEATDEGKVKASRHPLYSVLTQQPNPWMTMPQFVQSITMGLLTWGNSYAVPDTIDGQVIGLWPLPPERVTMYHDSTGQLNYRHVDANGKSTSYGAGELLHFRIYTVDGLTGLAPLDYHRLTFGFEQAAQTYASALYNNGGRPSGVLEFPNALLKEQKEVIRQSWSAMHGGPSGVGSVAILDGGVKYNPISAPLEQMKYVEAQKFSVEQIARIFGVAPHLIGAATQPTYASVEQQSLEFLRYTIQPIVIGIERTIQAALLQQPFMFRFNLAGFERSDIKTRYDSYATGRQWGFLSVNDIRDLEEMNRVSEGDVYLQPLNMGPAGAETAQEQSNGTKTTGLPA